MELTRVENLLRKLKQLEHKYWEGKPPEVVVGYTQSYALVVHEKPAQHKKSKKWKYLTDPARRLRNDGTLDRIILTTLKAGKKVNMALLRAGMRIQRDSQEEVPVDTSALKASAFTAYHYEVEKKSKAAFALSEARRKSVGEFRGKK